MGNAYAGLGFLEITEKLKLKRNEPILHGLQLFF